MYRCSLWGPTCDGLDRIVEQCNLPDMHVGDWLLFENMGAYTVAASSTFNGFQKPDIHNVISRPAWLVNVVQAFCCRLAVQMLISFLVTFGFRQHVQQIWAQGLPVPAESCMLDVPACCGREKSLEIPSKSPQAHVV